MNRKGFTLIEVLVVVIIIGILATFMLPQTTAMLERVKTAEAKSTMRSMRNGLYSSMLEIGVWPTSTVPLSTTAAIRDMIGGAFGEESERLYEYALSCGSLTDPVRMHAERNENSGGNALASHTCLKMVIYNDGSADPIVAVFFNGPGIPRGSACVNGW